MGITKLEDDALGSVSGGVGELMDSSKYQGVYEIEKGDTLWSIAEKFLDDPKRYPEIAELNNIKNPDLIYTGNKLFIPNKDPGK